MDIVGFDHVNLTVRDLDESTRWYGRLFRFAPVEEGVWEGVRWSILRSGEGRGSAMLCLYERPDYRPTDGDVLREMRLHGVRHFGLRIDDEAAWREILSKEGLEAEVMRWPHSTSWYVTDPTGYDIEVALWHEGRVTFGKESR